MKKILSLLIVLIITFSTTVFAASEPQVSFTVDGKAQKGEKITINIMAKDVSNLYALSADYIYNPEFIKVNSIEGASLIKDSKDNLMEPGGQVDKDGNRANYQMTFTGKVNGVSGSGAIVKIEVEVLKDFAIELTEENMKVKLVKVDKDYNVDKMTFVFNDFKIDGNKTEENKIEENKAEENKVEESDVDLGVTSSDEAEKKPSNQGFGSGIKDIFRKIFKINLSSDLGSSTSEIVEGNKNDEEETSDEKTLKEDSKDIENSSENNVGENKVVESSKTNVGGIILTSSIFVIIIGGAVAIVRKKRGEKK